VAKYEKDILKNEELINSLKLANDRNEQANTELKHTLCECQGQLQSLEVCLFTG